MSKIREGLDKAIAHQVQNIVRQNPKGSSAEQILLGRFLGSDQGTYARNVLGKNHKGWIDHITWWLKMYQPKLQKEFTEVDFTDLESLAYDMYENYLAKQGQLDEGYSAGASGGAGLGEKINTPGGMGQSYRKYKAGPSGIKKKKNETAIPMFTPETKMVNANDPSSDGWKVYSAKPSGILEGIITEYDTKIIDSVVERLPKGLTINNFTNPAFKEFLYQKYYGPMKAGWDKLWPFFSKEYKEKHGIKEYKQDPYQIVTGDADFFDNMLRVIPKGLSTGELYTQAFKEFLYNKFANKEWTDFKKNRFTYWDAYEKMGGSKPQGFFGKLKSKIGMDENLLRTYGDQFGLDEDVYTDSLYKEFLDSEYNKNQGSYIDTLRNLGQFMRSKDMPEEKVKPLIRKLIAKLHPSGINEEQMQIAELKCWAGYTRVRGVPAGAPGSCKKKTKESNIIKGLNNEEYLPHYTLGGKIYKSFTPADKLKNEPGSDTSDLENEANKEQLRRKMKEILASLPERQRQVLILRFYKNKTLDQAAEIMDVSPERIRQMEIKALHRIKTYFRGLDSFILDKARDSDNWLNSFFRYNPLRTDEYKEVPSQRKIEFSKENPPDLYYLYQQFIQRMLDPENTVDPYDWIDQVNKYYGLNYSWKDYQKRGHNDHTDNWQKIINKYILKK